MAKGNDKNYVSLWFWLFALFITALPCVGLIMIVVWAFYGENESRKNYFRAVLVWFLIAGLLWGALMAVGLWPAVQQKVQTWIHQYQQPQPQPHR